MGGPVFLSLHLVGWRPQKHIKTSGHADVHKKPLPVNRDLAGVKSAPGKGESTRGHLESQAWTAMFRYAYRGLATLSHPK